MITKLLDKVMKMKEENQVGKEEKYKDIERIFGVERIFYDEPAHNQEYAQGIKELERGYVGPGISADPIEVYRLRTGYPQGIQLEVLYKDDSGYIRKTRIIEFRGEIISEIGKEEKELMKKITEQSKNKQCLTILTTNSKYVKGYVDDYEAVGWVDNCIEGLLKDHPSTFAELIRQSLEDVKINGEPYRIDDPEKFAEIVYSSLKDTK